MIANRTHTYALAGSYTVTVRVTDKDLDSSEASFAVEVNLTDKVLLGNDDVEISGARSQILGNVHANRDVKISGAGGDVCGDLTAGQSVVTMGTQSCGTTTAPAPLVVLPSMANYVPTTATHTLSGDRVMNGYTCTLVNGCVVRVTGKLEIRGVVTGKVWFLVDKDVVIKGDLAPANALSKLRIYSKLTIDAPASKASISGQFLAEAGLKLSGSTQILTGLFWGRQYVDMSGSNGSLRGGVISNGSIKLAGSSRTVTYDSSAIKL
jgi:cytoskeletal protein CcmA (bactofilin family)